MGSTFLDSVPLILGLRRCYVSQLQHRPTVSFSSCLPDAAGHRTRQGQRANASAKARAAEDQMAEARCGTFMLITGALTDKC